MTIKSYKAFQNGKWISTKEYIDVINPTTLKVFAKVPAMQKSDIDTSLKGSREAFLKWSNLSWQLRVKYLEKFADELLKNKISIANQITNEVAKNPKEALAEVERSVEYIRETNKQYSDLMKNPLTYSEKQTKVKGKSAEFTRVPHGIVLAISPFNYPVNLAITKIAPALVAGNSVLFKPASQGVICGIALTELLDKIKLPKGVFNLITGRGRDIGDYIVTHKEIDMINFTGSTDVGNKILQIASKKIVVLELGGKDPAIILGDIKNYLNTVREIVKGAFLFSGQRCTAIKRIFIEQGKASVFEKEIVSLIEQLSIGSPYEQKDITPLIDQKSADYAMHLIKDAVNKGAKVLIGNKNENNLVYPTVLTDVTEDMEIAWAEQFAPVLPIIKFKNIEKAIELTNRSEFGLQASIFTNDIKVANEIANKLDVGTININKSSSRGPDIFPFIGVKSSGFGVQGLLEALLSVTRYKGIVYNK